MLLTFYDKAVPNPKLEALLKTWNGFIESQKAVIHGDKSFSFDVSIATSLSTPFTRDIFVSRLLRDAAIAENALTN